MKLSDEVINSLSLNLRENIEKRKYRRDKT